MHVHIREEILESKQHCPPGVSAGAARVYASRPFDGPGTHDLDLSVLGNASTMKDSVRAAEIIADILEQGGKVAAICDYDSDGCHSAAVIYRFAMEMGYYDSVKIFTPSRMRDGYGANPRIVDECVEWGASLIMTADNGISTFAAVDHANSLGIPFVITDHHLPAAQGLPAAYAVVDPARPDCNFANGYLCGAVVVFLVMNLVKDLLVERNVIGAKQVDVRRMFQLLAAATIADCVPVLGQNRALVRYGLRRLNGDPYPGYHALLTRYRVEKVDEEVIGFKIGPSINSAGRLGPAAPAITFLVTDDAEEADKTASFLFAQNAKRKDVQKEVTDGICAQINEMYSDREKDPILVFWDKSWHHGVVGIASGRTTERHLIPSFVFGGQEGSDVMKGSGRSGETDLHLKDFMDLVNKHHPGILLGYGGHRKAAGCSVKESNLPAFQAACIDVYNNHLNDLEETSLAVDGKISFDRLSDKALTYIFEMLEAGPFGQGFPRPEVVISDVPLAAFSTLGSSGEHMKVDLGVRGLAFNQAADYEAIKKQGRATVTLIASPTLETYKGNERRQFMVNRIY